MALIKIGGQDGKNFADWLLCSLSPTTHIDEAGSPVPMPDNLLPNPWFTEFDESGPVGWELSGLPPAPFAYHVNMTPEGFPRKTMLQRQNPARLPLKEAWVQQEEIAQGVRLAPTSERIADAPGVDVIPPTTKGYAPGTYGLAFGYSSSVGLERPRKMRKHGARGGGKGGSTPPGGSVYFALLTGQIPRIFLPDSHPAGATHLDIYLTKPNGVALFLQLRVKIQKLAEYVDLPGPLKTKHAAPTKNTTGVGETAQPRRSKDYYLVHSRHSLRAGKHAIAIQLEQEGVAGLISRWGQAINVKSDYKWVEEGSNASVSASVEVSSTEARAVLGDVVYEDCIARADADAAISGTYPPRSADAIAADAAISGASDPRDIRPSGKLPENDYVGEEVDFYESAEIANINNSRAQANHDTLILTQALNRAAYRKVLGDSASVEDLASEEGYTGNVSSVPPAGANAKKWKSVGIATEDGETVLIVGDYLETETVTEMVCEQVSPDGSVTSHAAGDVEYEDVSLGWDLVVNNKMNYSYSGSYGTNVSTTASRCHALGVVSVQAGGSQVAITDGSLPSGVGGRTYSDGRIILSSSIFARATTNAKNAIVIHELFHGLGFGHVTVASVLNSPVYLDRTTNYESPTSYDQQEYTRVYGAVPAPGGGGGGGGTEPAPEPTPEPTPEPKPEPKPKLILVATGYMKDTAIRVRTPQVMRGNLNRTLRWTAWDRYEPGPDSRGATADVLRMYPKKSRFGSAAYFNNYGKFEDFIQYNAYPPEEEPSGLMVGGVSEQPQLEDETQIETPDPSSVPDPPGITGKRRPAAGKYLASINAIYEDDTISKPSPPVPVTLANVGGVAGQTEMARITPKRSVNRLANADFTALDAQGNPENWLRGNIDNVATNLILTDPPGTLTIDATVNTTLVPVLASRLERISSEDVLTASGMVGAERIVNGAPQLRLRQYDSTGAQLTALELEVGQVSSGKIPVAKTFHGAGVTSPPAGSVALGPDTAFVSLVTGFAGSTVNAAGSFRSLKLLFYPFDVRVVEFAEPGDPDNFEAGDVPGSSFVAVGEPPVPLGSEATDTSPPVEILDFESGTLPVGWGQVGGSISTVNPVHGTRSLTVSDGSKSSKTNGYVAKIFTSMDGARFAWRGLYRVGMRSGSTGYLFFHMIRDLAGRDLAYLNLYSNGHLFLVVNFAGKNTSYGLATGITLSKLTDVEIIYTGGVEGSLSVLLGVGAERTTVFSRSYNFGTRLVREGTAGAYAASENGVLYDLTVDQVVITPTGDIANRERPVAPSGYVPGPPDRPVLTPGTIPVYRTQTAPDKLNEAEVSRQAYVFVRPEDVPADAEITTELLKEPVFVKPGESYTLALFRRFACLDPLGSTGFRVRLTGEGLPDLDITLANALSGNLGSMTGTRGWHSTGVEDDWLAFTVPPITYDADGNAFAYTQAELQLLTRSGVFVWQDPLLTPGVLSVFADREAKRTKKRALTAEVTANLDSRPPAWESGITGTGVFYSDFGVKTEAQDEWPVGVTLETYYSTSKDMFSYSPETPDPEEIALLSAGRPVEPRTPERYLRTHVISRSDGFDYPAIAPGGIFLETWHAFLGVILREDGTHFPGVAFVNNELVEEDYPETTYGRIAGHVIRTRETDDIGRVEGITIGVSTEEARQELSLLCRTADLRIAIPTAGGTVGGRNWLIRCAEAIDWSPSGVAPRIQQFAGERHRQLHAVGTISEAEILESAPLSGPISPPVTV